MSSPLHHTHTSCHPFLYHRLLSPFSTASSSYFFRLILRLPVLYLSNYTERLEAVAWPGKQHNSCTDINIHLAINIRSAAQVVRTGGGGIECWTPGGGCLDEEAAASTYSAIRDTTLIKGDKFEVTCKLLSFKRLVGRTDAR